MDRAALDFAREAGVPYEGWVPLGGWAEDYPSPPGILETYPRLMETPSADPNVRTEWNVRDSDGTLIICDTTRSETSPGTRWTNQIALHYGRPLLIIDVADESFCDKLRVFVSTLPAGGCLNIAGPRESEYPSIYRLTRSALQACWPSLGEPQPNH